MNVEKKIYKSLMIEVIEIQSENGYAGSIDSNSEISGPDDLKTGWE